MKLGHVPLWLRPKASPNGERAEHDWHEPVVSPSATCLSNPRCCSAFASCRSELQAVRFVYVSRGFRGRSVAMSTTLKIRDETTLSIGGDDDRDFYARCTGRADHGAGFDPRPRLQGGARLQPRPDQYFHGLIQPSDAERSLNGFKMRRRRRIDPEKQFELAKRAFYTQRVHLAGR